MPLIANLVGCVCQNTIRISRAETHLNDVESSRDTAALEHRRLEDHVRQNTIRTLRAETRLNDVEGRLEAYMEMPHFPVQETQC